MSAFTQKTVCPYKSLICPNTVKNEFKSNLLLDFSNMKFNQLFIFIVCYRTAVELYGFRC